MARLVARVTVPAPAAVVFDMLVDWLGQGRWIPATTVRVQSGDGASVGSVIVARSAIGPIGFDDVLQIYRWQPPELVDVHHVGWLVRGPGRFRVVPVTPDSCQVFVAEQLDMPFGRVGEWAWVFLKPLARAGLQSALQRFRALAVEQLD